MHELLGLFATTEVFIYVFMEIVIRIKTVQRVIRQKAVWYDIVFVSLIFGGFSVFGTYTGIQLPSGAISSVRDLGPMVAGLIAGPLAGLGAGLIGGIHRYFLGGFTCIPCGLATIFAGLIGGIAYLLNKRKLLGIFLSIVLAIFVELLHGILALLIARPLDEALKVVMTAIPAMMIANSMGIAISIIVLERITENKDSA